MKKFYEMIEAIRIWLFGWEAFVRLHVSLESMRERLKGRMGRFLQAAVATDPGIDGILVTVGLCIIALLLCVVMKNSLADFINTIVTSMTKEAKDILTGTRV